VSRFVEELPSGEEAPYDRVQIEVEHTPGLGPGPSPAPQLQPPPPPANALPPRSREDDPELH
ncbi:MAG: hypothetical protein ACK4N5_11465, partial [Myxococcales bacterium]